MKFKKNWKRFFTLDRHHAEGFTLVELIVVIAILAILAGVAVPAYSGYITQTNKQADMTLVGDIEYALTLAYYNGDITEGEAGFILLMPSNAASTTPNLDPNSDVPQAMEKSFGAAWTDTLVLKYTDWGTKSQMVSHQEATDVMNSNFTQKFTPQELMSQVQAVTDAVNGLNIGGSGTLYEMYAYGDGQNAIDDVMKEYGITKEFDELSAAEQSNLLVLASASSITNGADSPAAELIPNYALYTAYAAENAEFRAAYETFQTTIANVDADSTEAKIEEVKEAYKALSNAATANGFGTWQTSNEESTRNAFNAIMKGVGNAMKDNGDAILADLGNANMFTSGAGNQLYNDYLGSVYASAGTLSNGMGVAQVLAMIQNVKGSAAVWYSVIDGEIYIDNSLPVNE